MIYLIDIGFCIKYALNHLVLRRCIVKDKDNVMDSQRRGLRLWFNNLLCSFPRYYHKKCHRKSGKGLRPCFPNLEVAVWRPIDERSSFTYNIFDQQNYFADHRAHEVARQRPTDVIIYILSETNS